MKLIDVTNSHIDLVTEQLGSTDANFIKVYTLGPTTVIFSGAPTHEDVLLLNKHRNIKNAEIKYAVDNILETTIDQVDILHAPNIVELSVLIKPK
ncbi:MAG: DUF1827 family protein [Carnobacterium sp.]|nr:DUF1827 family protein [Carnobacterium sp.]